MRPRDVSPSGRVERPPITERQAPPYVPDRNLTVFREGLRWSFNEGKVCVDGRDVSRLISDKPGDIGYWMGLAEGLHEYRKRISQAAREIDQFTRFEAVIEALMGKILARLKKVYDQKLSGISWSLQNGQLILNGINIRSFLALYRIRKTDKAKKFLRGLKTRMAVLLENRRESPDNERIREILEDLFREIEEELGPDKGEEAARSSRRLFPART